MRAAPAHISHRVSLLNDCRRAGFTAVTVLRNLRTPPSSWLHSCHSIAHPPHSSEQCSWRSAPRSCAFAETRDGPVQLRACGPAVLCASAPRACGCCDCHAASACQCCTAAIAVPQVQQLLPELYTIIVPTFKPLTQILLRLSELLELAVLQISNQRQVQVRVQLRRESQLATLRERPGLQVMFNYQFPVDGSGQPPPTTVSLCVEVPYLLRVIHTCRLEEITIMQVYDFWS